MKVTALAIPEVQLFEPRVFEDERGFFLETFQAERYHEAGLKEVFVQDNLSRSHRGVVRGLHFQHPRGQGKLVQVLDGEVIDVAVDIRRGSPTFGHWVSAVLSAKNMHQLWIPAGFAHGFCVTSASALLAYKCTDFYVPSCERTLRWDDPNIAIKWPVAEYTLSPKDLAGAYLSELAPTVLPLYAGRP